MYQQKLDENVKRLGPVTISSSAKAAIFNGSKNGHSGIVAGGNTQGVAVDFIYDTNFENTLLTVEMRLASFDENIGYYPFVHTYTAKTRKSVVSINLDSALLHTSGPAMQYATQGKVIVPRLQKQHPDEEQYVVVGYVTYAPSTVSNDMQIQTRLYLEEYSCAQPSK